MSNLDEKTPVNEEEVLVAIVTNDKDRDKRSKDLMFRVFDKLVVKEDNPAFSLIEACFPEFRITIKKSATNQLSYGLQGRVYDEPDESRAKKYVGKLYHHVTDDLDWWTYSIEVTSFTTIEDLIDHILDNFLI